MCLYDKYLLMMLFLYSFDAHTPREQYVKLGYVIYMKNGLLVRYLEEREGGEGQEC